jgi:hypothetical protein
MIARRGAVTVGDRRPYRPDIICKEVRMSSDAPPAGPDPNGRTAVVPMPLGDPAPRRSRLPVRDLDLAARLTRGRAAIAGTASRTYQRALDRALTTTEPVTSAAQGTALLASDEHPEALSDGLQKVVIAAIPAIRIAQRRRRFVPVPSVFLVSTALSVGMTARRGLRELQVVAALVDHRIEAGTGELADPDLVRAVAVALYLDPLLAPAPAPGRLRLGRVGRRWAVRGVLGLDTGGAARALAAAERLDGAAQAARWKDAAPDPG